MIVAGLNPFPPLTKGRLGGVSLNLTVVGVFKIMVIITLVLFLLTPSITLAADPDGPSNPRSLGEGVDILKDRAAGEGGLVDDDSESGLQNALISVITWILSLVAIIALGMLIWGCIKYIISLGNQQENEKARKTILYAIVGIIVVLLAFVVVSFVSNLVV